MCINGDAEVLYVGPCPEIRPGSGRVVTGTFRHSSANTIDVSITGLAEPIGCTANHRFWSEDREDYVEAGQLREGERVWTRKLGTTAVAGSVPRPGTHRVWNLEIHGEHVYEVGDLGVLVHNSYGHIALGLTQHPTHTNPGLLQKFAHKVKGSWWERWHDDGIISRNSWDNFEDVFHEAATNARQIHFNTDGISDLATAYSKGGVRGAFRQIDNVTNAVFRTIIDNPAYLSKTIFYDANGQTMSTASILQAIGL